MKRAAGLFWRAALAATSNAHDGQRRLSARAARALRRLARRGAPAVRKRGRAGDRVGARLGGVGGAAARLRGALRRGRRRGPRPVVLVHGYAMSRAYFLLLARASAAPGSGRSSASSTGRSARWRARRAGSASSSRSCAAHRRDEVDLVGHRMGGVVARYYVALGGGDGGAEPGHARLAARRHRGLAFGVGRPIRELMPGARSSPGSTPPRCRPRTRALAIWSRGDALVWSRGAGPACRAPGWSSSTTSATSASWPAGGSRARWPTSSASQRTPEQRRHRRALDHDVDEVAGRADRRAGG